MIWENIDNAAHLATSGTPDGGPDGIFDSGMIMAGSTFEHRIFRQRRICLLLSRSSLDGWNRNSRIVIFHSYNFPKY